MAKTSAFAGNEEEINLAVRASWLSYVGGYSQGEIAKRLGISRIKAHRLISSAHELGLVRITIDHSLSDLAELEEALIGRYRLSCCSVVPALDGAPALNALGIAGARFLRRQLGETAALTVGVGWGRTLAAVADQNVYAHEPRHRFVSLLGSLTRQSSANPYDVIHRLVDRTGSEGYYLPTPYIADTLADKRVFLAQKSVQHILALARRTELCLVGIGECAEGSFLKRSGLITDRELAELRAAGAVGDLIGKFFDADGAPVDGDVNRRSIGLELDELGRRFTVAIAGGADKLQAIGAALNSGLLAGLITDEDVARRLLRQPVAAPRDENLSVV